MATAPKKTPARTTNVAREHLFVWEGKDKTGKVVRGEIRATGSKDEIMPVLMQASSVCSRLADKV